jgi:2-methylisocitrate lyase-like PEP mutase family enzyme
MSRVEEFKELHYKKKPLLIGNVWDATSASLFEEMNYKAIGTSSAAVATTLGHEDGEQITFEQLNTIVKSILTQVSIPLTVDIEAGYSRNIDKVLENIALLAQEGVVGINFEDSIVENGNRVILDPQQFSETIKSIKQRLMAKGVDIFLNVRTDPYILGLDNPLDDSIARAKLYEAAGADGIFVPCVVEEDDINTLTSSISLPVNVMAMPTLPSFSSLEKNGIKRISMGPFLHAKQDEDQRDLLKAIEKDQSFSCLF